MAERQNKTAPGQFFAALDAPAQARPLKVGRRNRLVSDLVEEAHQLINTAKAIRAFDAKGNVWDVVAQLEDVMSATHRRTTDLVYEIEEAVEAARALRQPDPDAEDLGNDREPWEDTVAGAIKGAEEAIRIASELRDRRQLAGWAIPHLYMVGDDSPVVKAASRATDAASHSSFVRPQAPAPVPSQYQRSLQDRVNSALLGFDGSRDSSNLTVAHARRSYIYFGAPGGRQATAEEFLADMVSFRTRYAAQAAPAVEEADAPVKSAPGQDVPVKVAISSPSPADMPRRYRPGGFPLERDR